jgi:hypothetical protein
MPATTPAGVLRTRQRAGLEGDVGSVCGSGLLLVVVDESEGAKAIVSRSLASVASTLSSACS